MNISSFSKAVLPLLCLAAFSAPALAQERDAPAPRGTDYYPGIDVTNLMLSASGGARGESSTLQGGNTSAVGQVKLSLAYQAGFGTLILGNLKAAALAGSRTQGGSNSGGIGHIDFLGGGTNVDNEKGGNGYYVGLAALADFESESVAATTQAGVGLEGGFHHYRNGTRYTLGAFVGGGINQIAPPTDVTQAIEGTYSQNWGVYGAQIGLVGRIDIQGRLFGVLRAVHTMGTSMYSDNDYSACYNIGECPHAGYSDDVAATIDYKPWTGLPVVVEGEAKYLSASTNDSGSFQAAQVQLSVGGTFVQ